MEVDCCLYVDVLLIKVTYHIYDVVTYHIYDVGNQAASLGSNLVLPPLA